MPSLGNLHNILSNVFDQTKKYFYYLWGEVAKNKHKNKYRGNHIHINSLMNKIKLSKKYLT